MDTNLSKVLACLAFALSSVTAISVALAIFNIIDDLLLASIFATAAVLLDIFKYLGWPLTVRLYHEKRRFFAATTCICLSALGVISGWSTYDRLIVSIESSRAKHFALMGDRIEQLSLLNKKDSEYLEALSRSEKQLESDASSLRAKGMVSKAQELEATSLERIDKQRLDTMKRIKLNSAESIKIHSSTYKAASLPANFVILLCAGFALSLELVPALILSILHKSNPDSDSEKTASKPVEIIISNITTSDKNPNTEPKNETLLALIQKASLLPLKSKIKVKEFATEYKIGNLKACATFREAEALGAIKKTRLGYITI